MFNKNKKYFILISVILLVIGVYTIKQSTQKTTSNINSSPKPTGDEFIIKNNTSVTFEDLKKEKKPMILFFSQENCPPCELMKPIEKALYEKYKDKVIIRVIDVKSENTFVSKFPIRVMPTIFLIDKEGKPLQLKKELAEKLNNVIYKSRETNEVVYSVIEGAFPIEVFEEIIKEML